MIMFDIATFYGRSCKTCIKLSCQVQLLSSVQGESSQTLTTKFTLLVAKIGVEEGGKILLLLLGGPVDFLVFIHLHTIHVYVSMN